MNDTQLAEVYRWMNAELKYRSSEYMDCGEVNCTLLAENCASALDLCDDEGDIPEVVFVAAVDCADEWFPTH